MLSKPNAIALATCLATLTFYALGNPVEKVTEPSSIDKLQYWQGANSVRVVVETSGAFSFKQDSADDPERVFIDITPAQLHSTLHGRQWLVRSELLEKIRVAQYDKFTVRVVLDLGKFGEVTSFALGNPDRLIIDVLGEREKAPIPPITDTQPVEVTSAGPKE